MAETTAESSLANTRRFQALGEQLDAMFKRGIISDADKMAYNSLRKEYLNLTGREFVPSSTGAVSHTDPAQGAEQTTAEAAASQPPSMTEDRLAYIIRNPADPQITSAELTTAANRARLVGWDTASLDKVISDRQSGLTFGDNGQITYNPAGPNAKGQSERVTASGSTAGTRIADTNANIYANAYERGQKATEAVSALSELQKPGNIVPGGPVTGILGQIGGFAKQVGLDSVSNFINRWQSTPEAQQQAMLTQFLQGQTDPEAQAILRSGMGPYSQEQAVRTIASYAQRRAEAIRQASRSITDDYGAHAEDPGFGSRANRTLDEAMGLSKPATVSNANQPTPVNDAASGNKLPKGTNYFYKKSGKFVRGISNGGR
jgi:hypothetical protein